MNFANPQAWYLLFLLPLIAAGLLLFYQHRRKLMSHFVQEHLLDELALGFNKKHYKWKAILLMITFVLMVAALSRPQWGYHERLIKRHGLDLMIVIDVSKSMLTRDVLPSRLERTKLAVKDLVMKLTGSDRIGLIAFAGDAMLMCPLTHDYNGFLLSLDDLSTDSIPRGGTNIAQAIDESVKAYQGITDSDKAVILLTDGEEQEGDAIQAARKAHEKGIRIYAVGVGTREGDLIQVTNADGSVGFLKDADGNVVKSHLNENLLAQIAYLTGGAYIHSGATQFGLSYLYDNQLSKLQKHDTQEKKARLYDERFQWPLTLAFVFLLIEMLIPMRKRNITNIIIFLMLISLPNKVFASVAGDVNKANGLYKQGKFDDTLKFYEEALDQDKKSPVVKYDLGTALYKKGDYAKALEYLSQAAQDKDLKIKPDAEYNLGNDLYRSGMQKANTNVDEAIKTLQEALGHYGQTLAVEPKDQDALFNQDFVKKEIERLKQKKQQQQQNKQQNQKQKQQNQQNKKNNQNQQNQQNQQKNQNNQSQQNQQSQQNKQNQQNQQKNQQSSPESQAQKQQNAQAQAEETQKEIDRKQAEDLLQNYQENEEPKKLLNYMPKKIDDRPVLKDW